MTENRTLIFVCDGTRPGAFADSATEAWTGRDSGTSSRARATEQRERARDSIAAYLYGDWTILSWGSAPSDSRLAGFTGFYCSGPADGGFGAENQLARLASGLYSGFVVGGEAR